MIFLVICKFIWFSGVIQYLHQFFSCMRKASSTSNLFLMAAFPNIIFLVLCVNIYFYLFQIKCKYKYINIKYLIF